MSNCSGNFTGRWRVTLHRGTMFQIKSVSCVVFLLGLALPLLAQRTPRSAGSAPATPQASTPPATPSTSSTAGSSATGSSNASATGTTGGTASGSRRQEPCWKVAGVSPSALQQRRSIEQNTKSQVAAVCSDSSLTTQQRHQKIQSIHQQAQQEMQALIAPQQQEALKACRASRGEGKEAGHPAGAGGAGPCGETATAPEIKNDHKFN
ncbi:MAG TPA: hypothetical protein VKY85_03650 [Candidatus Angelobacter sp.]|nr:hypothetical protein [Candidatus Angelobacter sp.]